MYIYIYMYVCMYVCMYIYIQYIHTHPPKLLVYGNGFTTSEKFFGRPGDSRESAILLFHPGNAMPRHFLNRQLSSMYLSRLRVLSRFHRLGARWCPPVISWFIDPMNTIVISMINPSEIVVMFTNLAIYGAPPCKNGVPSG